MLGVTRQNLAIRLDRAVLIAARVAHPGEPVERLDRVGLTAQNLVELGPRGCPVLLGRERRGESQPSAHGVGMPAKEGTKLVDRPVEIAHHVEHEPELLPRLEEVRLELDRLAKRSGGGGQRRGIAARPRRPPLREELSRLDLSRARIGR
jgi:hypothetical protein